MKRPSFQFYPGDWQNDHKLRSCSPVARCLWLELLCIFHQSDNYGCMPSFLLNQISSKHPSKTQANDQANSKQEVKVQVNPMVEGMVALCLPIISDLAQMTSMKVEDVRSGLEELFRRNIPDVDENGMIYSKRMVKDEKIRQVRAIAGKKGGNPNLVKRNSTDAQAILLNQNPSKRLSNFQANPPAPAAADDFLLNQTSKQNASKPSSKFQPLHLHTSVEEKNIKEPPLAPTTAPSSDGPPEPPGGGELGREMQASKPATPDGGSHPNQDADDELDALFGKPESAEVVEAEAPKEGSLAKPQDLFGENEIVAPAPARKRGRASQGLMTFRTWHDRVKAAGEKPIPPEDPIFDYTEQVGLPEDFLELQWHEFREQYWDSPKKYAEWRRVFRLSVRRNWFKLWYIKEGENPVLTTAGMQAMRHFNHPTLKSGE